MLRLAEADSAHAEDAASRGEQSALDIHSCLRRLQSGAHAKPGGPQFRWRKSGSTCVSSSIELEPEATKTLEIKPFDIINHEQQKEKYAANHFFRSLLELLRDLFHKVLLKQILRPLRTLLSQQDRSCFRCGIRDVTLLMETIEDIPIVTLPCPPIWLVLKGRQIQQSQYRLVNFFLIYFHEAPRAETNSERRTSMSSPTP